MNFAFVISFLAGISTLLGVIPLFIKFKNTNKVIGCSLSFASGVMISVSLLDLIPTSIIGLNRFFYPLLSIALVILFLTIGIIISTFINKVLPSNYDNKLYKVGIFSMIAIILHNIPEGIATFLTTSNNTKLGISLALAIALHNIPEGISISVPIYFSKNSKILAICYTFISGISEFFGAVIAFAFLKNININYFLNFLYSIIAGIMILLSIEELLPNAYNYCKGKYIIIFFIIGFLLMGIVHFVI